MFEINIEGKKNKKKPSASLVAIQCADVGESSAVCNIVWAIKPLQMFLGHRSAGSSLHCSDLSGYYVTHRPVSPHALLLPAFLHSAYGLHGETGRTRKPKSFCPGSRVKTHRGELKQKRPKRSARMGTFRLLNRLQVIYWPLWRRRVAVVLNNSR